MRNRTILSMLLHKWPPHLGLNGSFIHNVHIVWAECSLITHSNWNKQLTASSTQCWVMMAAQWYLFICVFLVRKWSYYCIVFIVLGAELWALLESKAAISFNACLINTDQCVTPSVPPEANNKLSLCWYSEPGCCGTTLPPHHCC